jgi:hypothetical protein
MIGTKELHSDHESTRELAIQRIVLTEFVSRFRLRLALNLQQLIRIYAENMKEIMVILLLVFHYNSLQGTTVAETL